MTLAQSDQLKLLKFPASLFIGKPHSDKLISVLTKVINGGYKSKSTVGIITTPRIKNEKVFVTDLGFEDDENFLLVLVTEKIITDDHLKGLLASEVPIVSIDESFDFSDYGEEKILGTLGAKVVEKGASWELTGFVSKNKGVGTYLVDQLFTLAKEAGKKSLTAVVIAEHQGLLDYYSRLEFVEYGERLEQVIDSEGRVIGGELEDGIRATRNFNLAFLRKVI